MTRTVAALAIAVTLTAAGCARHGSDLYSGTLQAPSAAIGSTTGGRITQVLISEGDAVKRGQVIVRFDDLQQRGRLAEATARLGEARASLADLQAGTRPEDLARAAALAQQQHAQYEEARKTPPYQTQVLADQVRQARARLHDARATATEAHNDAERFARLYATGDASRQRYDAAVAQNARAQAQVREASAAVDAANAQLANASVVSLPQSAAGALAAYRAAQQNYESLRAGARPDQIVQAEASVRAAEGTVTQARQQLDETVVRAPADGVVSAFDLHRGDLIAPGASVATIDEAGNPFVRIYVPQAELGRFPVGTKLAVRSDALPGQTFSGVVENVDAQAQFTPQNVQTQGDRATLSFGVKVRIADPDRRLHGGTTVGVAFE